MEDLANLGLAQRLLARDRRQHAHHGLLHVVDGVVDDLVQLDIHALLIGESARLAGRAHVETNHDGGRGLGQGHVRFGDAAYARLDHADTDGGRGQVAKGVGDGLDRALHVGLEHDANFLDRAFLDAVEDVLQRHARVGAGFPALAQLAAVLNQCLGGLLVRHDIEQFAGVRHAFEPEQLHRG